MTEDAATRRRTMQAVRSEDTKPELLVRRLIHSLGYRYRLHRRDLPGKPDLAFPSRRKVIFVHGCFWHGHDCARGARIPKTNADYWKKKIFRNVERDAATRIVLETDGWSVLVIWECEIKNKVRLEKLIRSFLNGRRAVRVRDESNSKEKEEVGFRQASRLRKKSPI